MAKWQRFQYHPYIPLGDDGRRVTGSKEHIALSRRAAAEGSVLLKNEGDILPLEKGAKVALFGKASVDYVKGGGGSGDVTVAYVLDLCQTMEEKQAEGKISVFKPLSEFYRENVAQQRLEGKEPGFTVEPEIPAELLDAAANVADVAVISICRFSKEEWDRKGEKDDGDFYLSPQEQKMVADVSERFSKIVVVLNVGGMVDTSWFCHDPKIQGVLLAWQGGMEGAGAEADILCGDAYPSGKLVDTFAASFDDYPSSYNFNESEDFVCYTDDIFVGYRYFETIPGAAEKVNYPFGFGLGYTTFAMECIHAEEKDGVLRVAVRVTNTGKRPGKEVVQLYSAAPKCRMEMPKLELRAFGKTKELAAGESQVLELCFPVDELAVYDEKLAAYVIPAGSYRILAGNSVRDLEEVYSVEFAKEVMTCQLQNRCVPSKLPCRLKADGTYEQLEVREYEPKESYDNWPAIVDRSMEHILPDTSGFEIKKENNKRLTLGMVAKGEVALEDFLTGLTNDELITLVGGTANRGVADTRGHGGLDYLEIPAAMTADGPAGVRFKADRGVNTTAWPVATMLACSWDPELVYEVGVAGGMETEENNMAMWLTPAINIHRSPLCGRNFEYYSEDPLISGKLAAAMVRGIQSRGVSACVKHFCVNNKETNRKKSDSILSERALREIYIKAFEIVVKESDVWSVMTAYNIINGTYTSESKDLIKGILRGEWGYEGLVITDWRNLAEPAREVLAGNNIRMPQGSPKRLQKALEEGVITREDLIYNVRYLLKYLLRLK